MPPLLNNVCHRTEVHRLHIGFNKAGKAALYAYNLKPVVNSFAYHGSNGSVHARRIAAAGQDADSLQLCNLLQEFIADAAESFIAPGYKLFH